MNYKKSNILAVYLTATNKFGVVLENENPANNFRVSNDQAIMLRDRGCNLTNEALSRCNLLESRSKLVKQSVSTFFSRM
jgi:hypothetical protein